MNSFQVSFTIKTSGTKEEVQDMMQQILVVISQEQLGEGEECLGLEVEQTA